MSISRDLSKFIAPSGQLEYDNTTSGLSATTIKSAIDELNTLLGGGNVGSQATFNVYEFTATASQTTFSLSSNHGQGSDITAGNFVDGVTYIITSVGTTDFVTLYGASSNTVGVTFTANTNPGTGDGTAKVVADYIPGFIKVYINGVLLSETDYVASDGDNVVLDVGADVGALLSVVVLDSFNTATQLRVLGIDAGAPDNSVTVDASGNLEVTGTVTADGLTVDGLTQLNTNNLANGLTISGNDNANVKIRFDNTGTGGGDFVIQGGISGASNEGLSIRDLDNSAQRIYISPGGNISFYEDTGTTAKLFWDASAESLGIGTATPSAKLDIFDNAAGNANSSAIELTNYDYGVGETGQSVSIEALVRNDGGGSSTTGKIVFGKDSDYSSAANRDGNIQFYTNQSNSVTEAMRIDSAGNVVIGSGGLDVSGIGGTYTALNMRAGAGYPIIYGQTTATTTNSPAMQIVGATSGASAGGGAELLGSIQIAAESDSSTNATGYINFYTGSGGSVTERMRIDSAGNVGIGTSPATKLDINGTLRFTPNTADTNYSADIAAQYDSEHPFTLIVKNNAFSAEYMGVYADPGGSNNRVVFPTGNLIIGNSTTEATKVTLNRTGFLGSSTLGSAPTSTFTIDVRGNLSTDIVAGEFLGGYLLDAYDASAATGAGVSKFNGMHFVAGGNFGPSASDVDLVFATGLDGNATEKMRIDSAGQVSLIQETSNTTTRSDQLRIEAQSSGTTGVGFGSNIYFLGERNGGTLQAMGRIGFGANTNTVTDLSSDFIVETSKAGVTSESMRLTSGAVRYYGVAGAGGGYQEAEGSYSVLGNDASNNANIEITIVFKNTGSIYDTALVTLDLTHAGNSAPEDAASYFLKVRQRNGAVNVIGGPTLIFGDTRTISTAENGLTLTITIGTEGGSTATQSAKVKVLGGYYGIQSLSLATA